MIEVYQVLEGSAIMTYEARKKMLRQTVYTLEHTEDTVPGKANALKVGENTIDSWSYYRISENMTACEIADELLNRPTYFSFDEYNYTFMP